MKDIIKAAIILTLGSISNATWAGCTVTESFGTTYTNCDDGTSITATTQFGSTVYHGTDADGKRISGTTTRSFGSTYRFGDIDGASFGEIETDHLDDFLRYGYGGYQLYPSLLIAGWGDPYYFGDFRLLTCLPSFPFTVCR